MPVITAVVLGFGFSAEQEKHGSCPNASYITEGPTNKQVTVV